MFGIRKFIRSFKKTRYLHFFSQELTRPIDNNNPIEHIRLKREALDLLIKFSLSDPIVVDFLRSFNGSENTLRKIYEDMTLVAAITYNNGFYLPASCLIDIVALHYILSHYKNGEYFINNYDSDNSLRLIAKKLIIYFRTGDYKILIDQYTRITAG